MFLTCGLPLELYGDRFGAFVRNDDHWSLDEQLAGRQRPTQLGQAFEVLAITYIPAGTPKAKGRFERLWGTLHDRLTRARVTQVLSMLRLAPVLGVILDDGGFTNTNKMRPIEGKADGEINIRTLGKGFVESSHFAIETFACHLRTDG
jgi:hypothetical protein